MDVTQAYFKVYQKQDVFIVITFSKALVVYSMPDFKDSNFSECIRRLGENFLPLNQYIQKVIFNYK